MKLKIVALLSAFVLMALTAHAQVVTATAKAIWTQPNTVAEAQSFTYKLADGTATPVAITGVLCTMAVPGVVSCQGTIPSVSSGPHSFIVLASSPDGALTAASLPLVGTMPGAPTGPKITVTVTIQ